MRTCSHIGASLKMWILFKKLDYILMVLGDISQYLSKYEIFLKRYIKNPNILLTISYIKSFNN